MKFVRLLLCSTALMAAATSAAHAEPVTAALLGAAFVAANPITAGLISLGISAAASYGLSLIQKATAKKSTTATAGTTLSIQVGDDQPISFIAGKYATAGKRKYTGSWGDDGKTPNAYVTDVIEIGSLPNRAGERGLTSVWMDDQEVGVLWDEPHPDGRGFPIVQYRVGTTPKDFLWIKFLDGTQTGADTFLVSKFGADPDRPWQSDMIGLGCQAVILTARFNTDLFRGGIPAGLYEPHPLPLYDLRKDSTNGGSGAHRWDNQGTWEPSVNPMVVTYNVIRGVYFDDEWVYGGQNLAAFRLPPSSWIAAMNECDAAVTLSDGTTEPAFRAGYEFHGDESSKDAIEKIRKACNARIAEVGGIFKVLVGSPGAAVYAFTDDDILVTADQTYDPFPSLDDTINGIEATYPEPTEKWATKDAPARYDDALEAEDGNRRLPASVTFEAAPYGNQVQRLMLAMLQEDRRWRNHQFLMPPDAYALEPNDVVSWTSARNGYSNKKFLINKISGSRSFNQPVVLKEIDPADYDWSSGNELPTAIGWTGAISAPSQPMTGWSVAPATIKDSDGVDRRPAIQISCASDLDDVMSIWVKVRLKSTGAIVFDSQATAYASPYTWTLSGDWCLPATDYEAQGKYIPYSNRSTDASDWLAVTTPDIKLSLDDLAAEIVSRLDTLQGWIDDDLLDTVNKAVDDLSEEVAARVSGAIETANDLRAIIDNAAELVDRIANNDFAQYAQKEQLRQTLTADLSSAVASFNDQITVAVSTTSAIAVRVTTLEASTSGLTAQVSTVSQASVDGLNSLAQQIALLSAGSLDQFDYSSIWYFDSTVEGWSGNGTPTVANGYLRPANDASDPYVMSPFGLAADGAKYSQVRGRIKKTGSPTWEGYLWWRSPTDTTWDTSRRISLTAPGFGTDGTGLITFTPGWAGTIDMIRIDLSAAQTSIDYFEFDWIAVGRPSPGASAAQLAAEQTARTTADSALTSSITSLSANLTSTQTAVTGLSSAVSGLSSTVTTLSGTVSSQGSAITALNAEIADKADIDALSALSAEVDALGGGGVVSQGSAITAIRNSLLPIAAETLDQDFANFLGKMDTLNIASNVSAVLTSQIVATNSSVDVLSKAITQVQATLPNLASATSLTALTARVTAAEGNITSQSSAITSINSTLGTKASTSALNALSATVSSQAGQITAITSSLTDVQASVADVTADSRFKMEVVAGPTGYARIAAIASFSDGAADRQAGWYIDVPSDTSQPTLFLVQSNQFAIADNKSVPFLVSGGVTYLNSVVVEWANIYQAIIDNLQVTNAQIANLTVDTLKIAYGALTQTEYFYYSTTSYVASGNDVPSSAKTMHNVNPSPVKIYYSLYFELDAVAGGSVILNLINATSGYVIAQHAISKASNTASKAVVNVVSLVAFDPAPSSPGDYQYKWTVTGGQPAENLQLKCIYECMKR